MSDKQQVAMKEQPTDSSQRPAVSSWQPAAGIQLQPAAKSKKGGKISANLQEQEKQLHD